MIFAMSNIAWKGSERLQAYRMLRDAGFSGLEIAPGLLLREAVADVFPSEDVVQARLSEAAAFGLTMVSMQSLLFGVEGAALFGTSEEVKRLDHGLSRAIRLAGRLGIGNLVFGSPRQRVIPDGMQAAEVEQRVADVFGPLGELARENGAVIALEPNPAQYGTNFMTTFAETLAVVDRLDHSGITVNFDTGALHMTGRYGDMAEAVTAGRHRISHVHLSRPFLEPAPASSDEAIALLRALALAGYKGAVSIEMKAVPDDGMHAVENAIRLLRDAINQTGVEAGCGCADEA